MFSVNLEYGTVMKAFNSALDLIWVAEPLAITSRLVPTSSPRAEPSLVFGLLVSFDMAIIPPEFDSNASSVRGCSVFRLATALRVAFKRTARPAGIGRGGAPSACGGTKPARLGFDCKRPSPRMAI